MPGHACPSETVATTSFESRLSRLWAHEKASYGLRVFIALAVAMGLCWHWQQLTAVPALFLGAIASAIAETDDNWLGRSKSVLLCRGGCWPSHRTRSCC